MTENHFNIEDLHPNHTILYLLNLKLNIPLVALPILYPFSPITDSLSSEIFNWGAINIYIYMT